jgi:hypothetical protein
VFANVESEVNEPWKTVQTKTLSVHQYFIEYLLSFLIERVESAEIFSTANSSRTLMQSNEAFVVSTEEGTKNCSQNPKKVLYCFTVPIPIVALCREI